MRAVGALAAVATVLLGTAPARATVYLFLDAEDGTVGDTVPNPPFCQTPCSGTGALATYESTGGAPQGSKYYQWAIAANQTEHYTEVHFPGGPVTGILGRTIYYAFFFNTVRIGGVDVWHECTSCQSADKGEFLFGDGLRWTVGFGQWEHHAANQDHRYTVWQGCYNSYGLCPDSWTPEAYVQNRNGYSPNNPIQLEYERWYSVVQAIGVAADNTGFLAIYIDGVLIFERTGIQTAAHASPTIGDLYLGGTIAQPAYDAPTHYKRFDAFIVTDDWADIVDGGYLGSVGACATDADCTSAPSCRTADGAICTAGSCSYPPAPAGALCDDGNGCTGPDVCNASGACVSGPTTCACQTTADCTTAPDCRTAQGATCTSGQCSYPPLANGTACDDGNYCTTPDACDGAGTCAAGPNTCTCQSAADCAAAPECRAAVGVTCVSGLCNYPSLADGAACTADANQCTADVCQSGACTHTPKAAGTPCDDFNVCTGPGACSASGVCISGPNTCTCQSAADCPSQGGCRSRVGVTCVSGLCNYPSLPDGGFLCLPDSNNGGCGCRGAGTTAGAPALALAALAWLAAARRRRRPIVGRHVAG